MIYMSCNQQLSLRSAAGALALKNNSNSNSNSNNNSNDNSNGNSNSNSNNNSNDNSNGNSNGNSNSNRLYTGRPVIGFRTTNVVKRAIP
jgi:hypothetical protein